MNVYLMKGKFLVIVSCAFFALSSLGLHAESGNQKTQVVIPADNSKKVRQETKDNDKPGKVSMEKFVYNPPMRGAPAVRIGGGTRGIGGLTIELVVIAPDHTGLTVNEQPKLYWYVSKPAKAKLELTLINDKSDEPVYESIVAKSTVSGIQSIDLSKTKIKLKPNLEYRWFVSAVEDNKQRSNDVVASGMIKYIIPGDSLKKELKTGDISKRANVFIQNGIWYDAIDSLMISSKSHPEAPSAKEQKISLLKQVGLQSVADYLQKQKD